VLGLSLLRRILLPILALITLAVPARAAELVLICTWQGVKDTYYVDLTASTVSTLPQTNLSGQFITYPAQITDWVIQWGPDNQKNTIDRYSGILYVGSTGISYQCLAAQKRAIE
jgi:hypothetical protein